MSHSLLVIVVVVPLLAVWVIAVVDIVRTPRPAPGRLLWLLTCTLVWPVVIVYWLTRPTPGRAVAASGRASDAGQQDARQQLVALALAHERGRIDDAEFSRRLAALRHE